MSFRKPDISIIYVAFYATIAVAVYTTGSGHCLWAMLLAPSIDDRKPNPTKPIKPTTLPPPPPRPKR